MVLERRRWVTKRIRGLISGVTLVIAHAAFADVVTYLPLQSGDDERVDASGACPREARFDAGTVSGELHLKIGGDTAGCDSEWATSVEFDLSAAPSRAVSAATLLIRKTGYSDDSQGFAAIGAFAYPATGSVVTVERDDLTPDTALSIVYPSAANVDLAFEVTAAIQDLLLEGRTRAGLLLAGVYSEVGYEDWISVGSKSYVIPPRLVVTFELPIGIESSSWSASKRLYR